MRSARAIFCILLVAVLFLLSGKHQSFAQTDASPQTTSGNSFNTPNMDPDVPRNQHTYAQAVTIEVLSAINCILTGIDIIDPTQGCVGINRETNRLGISKPEVDEYNRPKITGILGMTTGLIAQTFEPVASTATYTQYLSDNFGVVNKAYASRHDCDPSKSGYGICGLRPILKLWETVRNIAYILLTLVFVFIGIGVMLRIKIDPRTVMTIQNQIPKAIISIVLITLSYGISALLIDTMWLTTYAGSYLLTTHHNPEVADCTKKTAPQTLTEKVSTSILQSPVIFFNQVFARCANENNLGPAPHDDRDGGFHVLTKTVANNAGETIGNVARSLILDEDDLTENCDGIFNKVRHPIKCAKKGAVSFLTTLITVVVMIIIFVTLVITMFKIWFNLLKAFIYTLLYIIVAPVMIVFGLLPSKPMGFENWLRRLFVNVAIFPITAWLFVIARLLMDLYDKDPANQFIPPLVGNPSTTNFGAVLAFGVILIIPHMQVILQEKMGVKGIGSPGLIGAAITQGRAVAGAPATRMSKHLNRRDQRGNAQGMLSVAKEKAGEGVLNVFAKRGSKIAERKLVEAQISRDPGSYYKTTRQIKEEAKEEVTGKSKSQIIRTAEERSDRSRANNWFRRKNDRRTGSNDGSSSTSGSPSGGPGSSSSGGGTPGKTRWWQLKNRRNGGSASSEAPQVFNVNISAIKNVHEGLRNHLDTTPDALKPKLESHVQRVFAERTKDHPALKGKKISDMSADERNAAKSILDNILEEIKRKPPK
jgi:uncharacterized membrane protein YgcG